MFQNELVMKSLIMRQLGYKVKDISFNINVNRRTLCRWNQSFKDDIKKAMNRKFGDCSKSKFLNNECMLLKSQNRKSHLANKELLLLCERYFARHPFSSRSELRFYLIKTLRIKISLNSISKIIKHLRFTRKTPRFMTVKSKDDIEALSQKRILFQNELSKHNVDNLVFVDETGFNKESTRPRKGLSRVGERLHFPLKRDYIPHRSVLMAVTSNEVLNYHIISTSFNTESFRDFISSTIDILRSNSSKRKYILVFDNASFHKSKATLDFITDSGHGYSFTPPYSPNHNAIENYFSLLKRIYSKVNDDCRIKETVNLSVDDKIEESIALLQFQ